MKKFTEEQPKDGDVMLHCGHLKGNHMHFFKVKGGPLTFSRPDGSLGQAEWIIACDVCFQHAGGDAKKINIRGDDKWKGDEPFVTRDEV